RLGAPVADHERVGEEVARAAAVAVEERDGSAQGVEGGQEVEAAGDVAHERLLDADRQAAGVEDAQAERLLAESAPLAADLEPDRVGEGEDEGEGGCGEVFESAGEHDPRAAGEEGRERSDHEDVEEER